MYFFGTIIFHFPAEKKNDNAGDFSYFSVFLRTLFFPSTLVKKISFGDFGVAEAFPTISNRRWVTIEETFVFISEILLYICKTFIKWKKFVRICYICLYQNIILPLYFTLHFSGIARYTHYWTFPASNPSNAFSRALGPNLVTRLLVAFG